MSTTIGYVLNDGAAVLTLNRPDRLNSFTAEMHGELAAAIDKAEADGARALLLTGAGKGFCAGQDLNDPAVNNDDGPTDLGSSVENYYNPLVRRLAGLPIPVICAVNGVAAGAGASLAFACDIVIAAKSAKFILSFANIGLIPDTGGTWVLPRLIGQARAMGMALTGAPVAAEVAETWGLIWKTVDALELMDEAMALARRFAAGPTLGLAATKQALRGSFLKTLDQALDDERDLMRRLGQSKDYREGVAAFLEKRNPNFTGS